MDVGRSCRWNFWYFLKRENFYSNVSCLDDAEQRLSCLTKPQTGRIQYISILCLLVRHVIGLQATDKLGRYTGCASPVFDSSSSSIFLRNIFLVTFCLAAHFVYQKISGIVCVAYFLPTFLLNGILKNTKYIKTYNEQKVRRNEFTVTNGSIF